MSDTISKGQAEVQRGRWGLELLSEREWMRVFRVDEVVLSRRKNLKLLVDC